MKNMRNFLTNITHAFKYSVMGSFYLKKDISSFFYNASEKEKRRVFKYVIEKANEDQRKLMTRENKAHSRP